MISLYAQFLAINFQVPIAGRPASLATPPPPFFLAKAISRVGECPLCPMANNCQPWRDLQQPATPELPDAVDIKRPNY